MNMPMNIPQGGMMQPNMMGGMGPMGQNMGMPMQGMQPNLQGPGLQGPM